MQQKEFRTQRVRLVILLAIATLLGTANIEAQTPTILLPDLAVRTVQTGLTTPTSIAFLGTNDYFVTEKNTGKVLRNHNGVITTVLDLRVNFASERGLLGIALHPEFPTVPDVYLFWTCVASAASSPFPSETRCNDASIFGEDSDEVLRVPLLGNRIDRFVWNGTNLVYLYNLTMLRSYQNDGVPNPTGQGDEGQVPRGNHDGGVIAFGPDGKLYVFYGDQGRRSQLQNLPYGPIRYYPPSPLVPVPDDQFGGPQPDDAHFSGVILRINPDGSPPGDNPFFSVGSAIGGEVGENLQFVYAYGLRNSFGMTIHPKSGLPWITEHGDDSFDEINRVFPGMNGGWVQVMGPLERISQFKQIETTFFLPPEPFPSLQQWRWPPSQIANTAEEALARMFILPGAQYSDPEFSWKWAALPVGLEFIRGEKLGSQYEGDLFANLVGQTTGPGYLIRFRVSEDGTNLSFEDPRLNDRVADNNAKYDLTESESLIVGSGYGIATDLEMSPRGTLYVVSHSKGEIYEIYSTRMEDDDDDDDDDDKDDDVRGGRPLDAQLTGAAEVPGPGDPDGRGTFAVTLNQGRGEICYQLTVSDIAPATAAHIHVGSASVAGPVVVPLTPPTDGSSSGCVSASKELIKAIRKNPEDYYVNVHNADYPGGAIRGQLGK